MSILIHTKIPPFHEDQPIDVGQVNLLNNNIQNLIQYWQRPLYFLSWYGGAVKPAAVLATDRQEKEFISVLGSNLVRFTPWGEDARLKRTSGKFWGAFKVESTVKGDFIFHILKAGLKVASIAITVAAANTPEWFQIPVTSFTTQWQKPEDLTLSVSNTNNAGTVTLHEICIYGSPISP